MMIVAIPADVLIALPYQDAMTKEIKEVAKLSSFVHFLKQIFDAYEGFTKGPKQARLYSKLMDLIDKITPEDHFVQFEDEDFKVVKSAVEQAHWVTGKINKAYIPFYDAIEKAENK